MITGDLDSNCLYKSPEIASDRIQCMLIVRFIRVHFETLSKNGKYKYKKNFQFLVGVIDDVSHSDKTANIMLL